MAPFLTQKRPFDMLSQNMEGIMSAKNMAFLAIFWVVMLGMIGLSVKKQSDIVQEQVTRIKR